MSVLAKGVWNAKECCFLTVLIGGTRSLVGTLAAPFRPLQSIMILIWNKALPSEQKHTVTRKSCNIITDNSCIAWPCWYPFWYIYFPSSPLPYHLLPCMHPLPLAPLPQAALPHSTLPFPTLTTPPLPYTTIASLLSTPHPSAPLSFPFLPNPLIPYPTLPSHPSPTLPYHTPSIPYHTLSLTLSFTPLPSPRLPSPLLLTLPSTALPYAILSSHLIYSLSLSTLSSHQLPTPPLPYPTTLLSPPLSYQLHHSLPSPYPLTWRTLSCHLTCPTPPISSPFSSPLGYPILPSRLYSSLSYPSLAPLCSALLPTLTPPPRPYPNYPRIPYYPLRSHPSSRPLPCSTLPKPTL